MKQTSEISGWIRLFAMNHVDRFPRADWPNARDGNSLWVGWSRAFAKHKISQAEAEAASIQLMQDPPEYLDHHLKAILRIIEGNRERVAFDRSEGRFAPAPNFGPSDPEAVELFRRFVEAKGDEKQKLLEELAEKAGEKPASRRKEPAASALAKLPAAG